MQKNFTTSKLFILSSMVPTYFLLFMLSDFRLNEEFSRYKYLRKIKKNGAMINIASFNIAVTAQVWLFRRYS